MRLALFFQPFTPGSGVPALAVTFLRRPTEFQASWSHPTEQVSELRTVIYARPLVPARRSADAWATCAEVAQVVGPM